MGILTPPYWTNFSFVILFGITYTVLFIINTICLIINLWLTRQKRTSLGNVQAGKGGHTSVKRSAKSFQMLSIVSPCYLLQITGCTIVVIEYIIAEYYGWRATSVVTLSSIQTSLRFLAYHVNSYTIMYISYLFAWTCCVAQTISTKGFNVFRICLAVGATLYTIIQLITFVAVIGIKTAQQSTGNDFYDSLANYVYVVGLVVFLLCDIILGIFLLVTGIMLAKDIKKNSESSKFLKVAFVKVCALLAVVICVQVLHIVGLAMGALRFLTIWLLVPYYVLGDFGQCIFLLGVILLYGPMDTLKKEAKKLVVLTEPTTPISPGKESEPTSAAPLNADQA